MIDLRLSSKQLAVPFSEHRFLTIWRSATETRRYTSLSPGLQSIRIHGIYVFSKLFSGNPFAFMSPGLNQNRRAVYGQVLGLEVLLTKSMPCDLGIKSWEH